MLLIDQQIGKREAAWPLKNGAGTMARLLKVSVNPGRVTSFRAGRRVQLTAGRASPPGTTVAAVV